MWCSRIIAEEHKHVYSELWIQFPPDWCFEASKWKICFPNVKHLLKNTAPASYIEQGFQWALNLLCSFFLIHQSEKSRMYYIPHWTVNRLVAMVILGSYDFASVSGVNNPTSVIHSTLLDCLWIITWWKRRNMLCFYVGRVYDPYSVFSPGYMCVCVLYSVR